MIGALVGDRVTLSCYPGLWEVVALVPDGVLFRVRRVSPTPNVEICIAVECITSILPAVQEPSEAERETGRRIAERLEPFEPRGDT